MRHQAPWSVVVVVVAAVASPASSQEHVVRDDSPLPPRSAEMPHPDDMVSADQLVERDRVSTTRRNLELALGVILIIVLLGYALIRPSRET